MGSPPSPRSFFYFYLKWYLRWWLWTFQEVTQVSWVAPLYTWHIQGVKLLFFSWWCLKLCYSAFIKKQENEAGLLKAAPSGLSCIHQCHSEKKKRGMIFFSFLRTKKIKENTEQAWSLLDFTSLFLICSLQINLLFCPLTAWATSSTYFPLTPCYLQPGAYLYSRPPLVVFFLHFRKKATGQ